MTEEAVEKKRKLEDASSPSPQLTFYIRSPSLHTRGDVVNGLLYALKDSLEISDWFSSVMDSDEKKTPPVLKSTAPVETVFVQNSRRPYFLVEFRYPTEMEKEKRLKKAKEDRKNEQGIVLSVDDTEVPPSKLNAVGEKLKQLSTSGEVIQYKGDPVTLSLSSGATVASEREKLELRDKKKSEAARFQKETNPAEQTAAKQPKATAMSFVPRTVRRRS